MPPSGLAKHTMVPATTNRNASPFGAYSWRIVPGGIGIKLGPGIAVVDYRTQKRTTDRIGEENALTSHDIPAFFDLPAVVGSSGSGLEIVVMRRCGVLAISRRQPYLAERKAAEAEAVAEFKLNEEQRKRLVVQERTK